MSCNCKYKLSVDQCQEKSLTVAPKDLDPRLCGDFKPDKRPFEWPRRKRVLFVEDVEQLELFETTFFGERIYE